MKFAFDKCSTPKVTSVSPTEGYPDATVTIIGSGFGTNCDVDLKFGGYKCVATVVNETYIRCDMDHQSTMPCYEDLYLTMNIYNRGISDGFTHSLRIVPKITSMSPSEGVMQGGTKVTFTGLGLNGKLVLPNGIGFSSSSYTTVEWITEQCHVTCIHNGKKVDLVLRKPDRHEAIICLDSNNGTFVYDELMTMSINEVSPVEVSGTSTTLTLNGTNLGNDTSTMTIQVGESSTWHDCVVQTTSATSATCDVAEIPAQSKLSVKFNDYMKGNAEVNSLISIEAMATVNDYTPKTGSIHGGASFTISGSGFPSDAIVTIDGTELECQHTLSSVTCVTKPHAAGAGALVVVANGESTNAGDFTFADSLTVSGNTPTDSTSCGGTSLTIQTTGTLDLSDTTKINVELKSKFCF